jgi:hypothetical protein
MMATEKRLIDANAVYEMGHRTPFHIGIADLCDLKELLADVPTVDAVEVVRCKDCVFYEKGKDYHPYCNHPSDGLAEVSEYYYCWYGERKTDAN